MTAHKHSTNRIQRGMKAQTRVDIPQDAKVLLNILENARTVRIGMIQFFYPNRSTYKAYRVINTVRKLHKGFLSKEKDYLLSFPAYKPDKRMDHALWLAVPFLESGTKLRFFRPMRPGTIGFVTKHKGYVVVCANTQEELFDAAREIDKSYSKFHFTDDPTKLRYIFVIHHPESLLEFPIDIQIPYMVCYQDYFYDTKQRFRPKHIYYFPNKSLEDEWKENMRQVRAQREALEQEKNVLSSSKEGVS